MPRMSTATAWGGAVIAGKLCRGYLSVRSTLISRASSRQGGFVGVTEIVTYQRLLNSPCSFVRSPLHGLRAHSVELPTKENAKPSPAYWKLYNPKSVEIRIRDVRKYACRLCESQR